MYKLAYRLPRTHVKIQSSYCTSFLYFFSIYFYQSLNTLIFQIHLSSMGFHLFFHFLCNCLLVFDYMLPSTQTKIIVAKLLAHIGNPISLAFIKISLNQYFNISKHLIPRHIISVQESHRPRCFIHLELDEA